MVKKILISLCLVLFWVAVFGYVQYEHNNTIKAIKDRGVILIGTTGDYNPMSYFDKATNSYVGYDIALAQDLANELNVKIKFVPTSWPTLMTDTIDGKFDLAISGITITKERKKKALMSKGYIENGRTFLCRKEDINKYKNLESLNQQNVRVMENPGGQNEKFARTYLKNAKIIIHNVNDEIPKLIAEGNADVMITETTEAKFYSRLNSKLAAPLADKPFIHEQIGVLMPKENKVLLHYVNKFIDKERDNGRLEELAKIYIYKTDNN